MSTPTLNFDTAITELQASLDAVQTARTRTEVLLEQFREFEDATQLQIAHLLRAAGARNINADAVRATVERPYILIPTGKPNEWWNLQSRILDQPSVGWLEQQTKAFNVYRVTRTMLNLMTDAPQWMRDETGVTQPAHAATVSGAEHSVSLTRGDEGTFKRKYGAYLGAKNADGTFKIKGGSDAWLRLVASMVADGLYPWQLQPVTDKWWNPKAQAPINPNPDANGAPIVLRDYQQYAIDEWLRMGVGTVTYPMGAGKSFIALWIISHFGGKILVAVDGTFALEAWQELLEKSVPWAKDRVTLTTYQSLPKYVNTPFDLFLPDEVHKIPAPTYSRIAFTNIPYRLGFSGSPWHERYQELIFALCGPPIHIPWAQFITQGVIQKVPVIMDVVSDDAAKRRVLQHLLDHRVPGRALIYCDWIQEGQELADALGVPFVYSDTDKKLETLKANDVCVVSRVGDSTLDLRDLSLVVNYSFQKNARRATAQRYGRGSHSTRAGAEFHIFFTTADLQKEPRALWGIQSNLAGVIETEVRDHTSKNTLAIATRDVQVRTSQMRAPSRIARPFASRPPKPAKPKSEMEELLAHPAIVNLIAQAEKDAGPYIERNHMVLAALKRAWDKTIDPEALKAIMHADTAVRYLTSYQAAAKKKLAVKTSTGYTTNIAEIRRIVNLAKDFKK